MKRLLVVLLALLALSCGSVQARIGRDPVPPQPSQSAVDALLCAGRMLDIESYFVARRVDDGTRYEMIAAALARQAQGKCITVVVPISTVKESSNAQARIRVAPAAGRQRVQLANQRRREPEPKPKPDAAPRRVAVTVTERRLPERDASPARVDGGRAGYDPRGGDDAARRDTGLGGHAVVEDVQRDPRGELAGGRGGLHASGGDSELQPRDPGTSAGGLLLHRDGGRRGVAELLDRGSVGGMMAARATPVRIAARVYTDADLAQYHARGI